MKHSHRRTKAVALVAALLLAAAAPALAAPATGPGGGPGSGLGADADLAPLHALWHRLVGPLRSLLGHPGTGVRAGDGPAAIVERVGSGADPDGTPSSGSESTGGTIQIELPADGEPTG